MDTTSLEAVAVERRYLVVPAHRLDELVAVAAEAGVQVEELPASGVQDLAWVAVTAVGLATSMRVVVSAIETWRGGQVVDQRPDAPRQAWRTRDVVPGHVLTIGPDGLPLLEQGGRGDQPTDV